MQRWHRSGGVYYYERTRGLEALVLRVLFASNMGLDQKIVSRRRPYVTEDSRSVYTSAFGSARTLAIHSTAHGFRMKFAWLEVTCTSRAALKNICPISTVSSVTRHSQKKSPRFKSLEFKREFIGHLGQQIFRIRELTVEMVQYHGFR